MPLFAVKRSKAVEGTKPLDIVLVDGDGGHDIVGQARVVDRVIHPTAVVVDAHTGIGGNPLAVGAVDSQVKHKVAQQTAVLGGITLPGVAIIAHDTAKGNANPEHAVVILHYLLDELHLQAAGLGVVLGPMGTVKLDDTVVVGTNPHHAALVDHQAVDRLVFKLLVKHGVVLPHPVVQAAEALIGTHPNALVVGRDGGDIVTADIRVAGIVKGPIAVVLCQRGGGHQHQQHCCDCMFHHVLCFSFLAAGNNILFKISL